MEEAGAGSPGRPHGGKKLAREVLAGSMVGRNWCGKSRLGACREETDEEVPAGCMTGRNRCGESQPAACREETDAGSPGGNPCNQHNSMIF
ncbi:MAG: hypothetical protein LUK37_05070 [Clostridia bacterium]|nr:hypothetical protein [Clostridia bacterium]